jgi:hypothetical protein
MDGDDPLVEPKTAANLLEEIPVDPETPAVQEIPVESETPVVNLLVEIPVDSETPAAQETPVEQGETPAAQETPVEQGRALAVLPNRDQIAQAEGFGRAAKLPVRRQVGGPGPTAGRLRFSRGLVQQVVQGL